MEPWYESLFENYAATYDKESFTQGTAGEVDFIEAEIQSDKSVRVLDVGCGTGRHAVELARRGYAVAGVDLSESQLARARQKAAQAGVSVDFRRADARKLSFDSEFDLVLLICEGAFPLMETDEMNYAILCNAYRALKPGGKMILTTLNALYPLFHSVKDFINANSAAGMTSDQNRFDVLTFRDHSEITFADDSGNPKTLVCNERYYAPCEMVWLLKSAGFRKVELFGCRGGAFSRNDKLNHDDYEMLVVSEK